MTIEFHCPFCQKLLRTPDDKAGVNANCPGCGEVVTVPDATHETAHADSLSLNVEPVPPPAEVSGGVDPTVEESLDAPGPRGEIKICPMCGAEVKQAAKRCRFCGENFVQQKVEGVPTRIEAGEVLSQAWEIFKTNFGILVGAWLVMFGIGMALNMLSQVVQMAIQFSVVGAGGQPPQGAGGPMMLAFGPAVIFGLLNFAVSCYLQAGFNRLLLRVARGENAEIAELFSARRYFWRFLLGNLLFAVMIYVGPVLFAAGVVVLEAQNASPILIVALSLLLIPVFVVGLMFWPFMYLIVDRDVGVIESFRRSRELMAGNYLACVVLGLAAMGAQFAGLLACCVGVIFSTPFVMFLSAVAYCRMNGETVVRS